MRARQPSSVAIVVGSNHFDGGNMKKIMLVSLLLASCASGPSFSALPVQTQIVVYRPSGFMSFSARFWIEDNGNEYCKLHNAAFVVHPTDPGKHTLGSSNFGSIGTSKITFDVKPGQTIYVKMEVNGQRTLTGTVGGILGQTVDNQISENAGPVYLGIVSKETAQAELQGLSQDCQ